MLTLKALLSINVHIFPCYTVSCKYSFIQCRTLPVIECQFPSHKALFILGIYLDVIDPPPLSAVNHNCNEKGTNIKYKTFIWRFCVSPQKFNIFHICNVFLVYQTYCMMGRTSLKRDSGIEGV